MTTEREVPSTNSFGLCEKLLMNWQKLTPDAETRQQVNVFVNILKSYTGLERQYRIMLEAVKLIKFYEYKQNPTEPMCVFENYTSQKEKIQSLNKEDSAKFWKRLYMIKEAKEYFEEVEENETANLSNANFLEQMITTMQEAKDEVYLPKVIEVYNRYPTKIGNWKRKVFSAEVGE